MALTGQETSQALHPKQSSGLLTTTFSPSLVKTVTGQTLMQVPQAVHFS
jgi:hypothetical protein